MLARWKSGFADIEESHTVACRVRFFRSRPHAPWVTAVELLGRRALAASKLDLPPIRSDCAFRAGILHCAPLGFLLHPTTDPGDGSDQYHARKYDPLRRLAGKVSRSSLTVSAGRLCRWRVNYDLSVAVRDVSAPPHVASDRSKIVRKLRQHPEVRWNLSGKRISSPAQMDHRGRLDGTLRRTKGARSRSGARVERC